MDAAYAQEVLDKIIAQIFGYKNPLSLEQFTNKFAFDLNLPLQVVDSTSRKLTWTQSGNASKFKALESSYNEKVSTDGLRPKKRLDGLQDVLRAWEEVNATLTERQFDSINVAESDNIVASENIYRSQDIVRCKNVLFSDGGIDCEYVAANQRSHASTFCIRLADSFKCADSFDVSWSESVTSSFFMQDCKDVSDSMFCTSLSGKRFCIANMQYEQEEYDKMKQEVIHWILSS